MLVSYDPLPFTPLHHPRPFFDLKDKCFDLKTCFDLKDKCFYLNDKWFDLML